MLKSYKIKKFLFLSFKVDIKIPSDDSELVTISGSETNVAACKAEILKIIDLIVSNLVLLLKVMRLNFYR